MPARCSGCDGTVMPYRRYMFYMRPTATCDGCGKKVRMRGWRVFVIAALVVAGSWALFYALTDFSVWVVGVTLFLAVVAFAVDWWSWHALTWDVVDEGGGAE